MGRRRRRRRRNFSICESRSHGPLQGRCPKTSGARDRKRSQVKVVASIYPYIIISEYQPSRFFWLYFVRKLAIESLNMVKPVSGRLVGMLYTCWKSQFGFKAMPFSSIHCDMISRRTTRNRYVVEFHIKYRITSLNPTRPFH